MIGQNDGFATAVTAGDAPQSAYTRTPVTASDLASEWRRSADRVQAAFAHAHTDAEVRLIEINPDNNFPDTAAVGMHLIDTVIHTWDVASSLGNPYRPDDELLEIVAAGAKQVPAGASRTEPGAAFAPAVTTDQTDSWLITLALLGREKDLVTSTQQPAAPIGDPLAGAYLRSVAFAANESGVGAPPLDHEVVRGRADMSQHHIGHVDSEPIRRLLCSRGELHRTSGELCLPAPCAGVSLRRIDALAVDRDTRIAAEILRAAGTRHHPQAELPVVEVDLGSADAR